MTFEREGCKPRSSPTLAFVTRELGRLRLPRTGFAILQASDGSYVQVGGSPAGMVLEKREAGNGAHYRGWQQAPVVPFPDGTQLYFGGGPMALAANEWFLLPQVVAVFTAFYEGRAEPDFVRWRDVTIEIYG